MRIKIISEDFTICKIPDSKEIDLSQKYCFVGRTEEELSLVCITENVPAETLQREDGWKGFRIEGMLDFSLIGILAGIAALLAEHKISIFAVSTYHTDYIFMKKERFEEAMEILQRAGYEIV